MRSFITILLLVLLAPLHAAVVTAQNQTLLAIGVPSYAIQGVTGSATEANAHIVLPITNSVAYLRVRAGATLPLLSSVTITAFKNGVATAMTCTVTPADGTNEVNDLVHPFLVTAGDTLSFQFVSAGLGVANTISASVSY